MKQKELNTQGENGRVTPRMKMPFNMNSMFTKHGPFVLLLWGICFTLRQLHVCAI